LSATRQLDRAGVRALLDVIASSPLFRAEMRKALGVYDLNGPGLRSTRPRPARNADELQA